MCVLVVYGNYISHPSKFIFGVSEYISKSQKWPDHTDGSETLEWEAHIDKITSKANSTLGFLRRNLKACPPKLREAAYFSLVRSSLEYSSAVWDPFRQKDIDKLEKIQRAAARFVTQNYRQTASVTSLMHNLGWTDLKTKRKNSRLLCMFKI